VNPKHNTIFQALVYHVEYEIQRLRRKLNLSATEHVLAQELAQTEKEKKILTHEMVERNQEVASLKELNVELQQKIDKHVYTIVVQPRPGDPIEKLTRVMTELKISEDELKKLQKNIDDTKVQLKHKERQLNIAREHSTQHDKNSQSACDEVKELKDKLKGNMSLIQMREIIWNYIIQQVK